MLGLENKIDTFRLQRKINEYVEEPLLAILPGATLAMLWQTIGHFEKILMTVSGLALLTGLIGILTILLAALNEHRREMAVLRAVGAHAYHVVLLFIIEAFLVVAVGSFSGCSRLFIWHRHAVFAANSHTANTVRFLWYLYHHQRSGY